MKKEMKRVLCGLIACVTLVGGTVGVYATSTASSCSISPGYTSKESGPVGISTSAYFHGANNASSKERLIMAGYCAWTGWPYSRENSVSMAIGGTGSFTETQSKMSNFYVKLESNGGCSGGATVNLR